MLDPELKKIMACPICKGDLDFREEEGRIICWKDRVSFRIEDDIPIMLEEEAAPLKEEERR